MKKYIIVKSKNLDYFEKYVNEAMNNGYYPIGGPFLMSGDGADWWLQAMVLR